MKMKIFISFILIISIVSQATVILPITLNKSFSPMASITVGTPPQQLSVLTDSGSNMLQIHDLNYCPSTPCSTTNNNRFNCKASTTCNQSTNVVTQQYAGSAPFSGLGTYDTVIAGVTVPNMYFGLMEATDSGATMGVGALSCTSLTTCWNFREVLFLNGLIAANMHSFFFTGTGVGAQGSVIFGGYNTAFVGNTPISWVPRVVSSSWSSSLTSVAGVDASSGMTILFDSGTSSLRIPGAYQSAVLAALGNGCSYTPGDYVTCTCTKSTVLPNINFVVNGISLSLPPASFLIANNGSLCYLNLVFNITSAMVCGIECFQAYHIIFDQTNQRIGLVSYN